MLVCSSKLIQLGKSSESSTFLNDAIEYARAIETDFWQFEAVRNWRSSLLCEISNELLGQGMQNQARLVMQEAMESINDIGDSDEKGRGLAYFSDMLASQGKLLEAIEIASGIGVEYWQGQALKDVSFCLVRSGKFEEAIICARKIVSEYHKIETLNYISNELTNIGKIEEANYIMEESILLSKSINHEYNRCYSLQQISVALAYQGKVEESIACARDISYESDKSQALQSISRQLAKQHKLDEALSCARGISDDSYKSRALQSISVELAKQGNWELAETTGMEISQLSERHKCWKTIAENSSKAMGWHKSLQEARQFQSDESCLFYLKGWAEVVNEQDADYTCIQAALSQLTHDSESIETLLRKYALHEVFFGNAGRDKINRLNRTLNIQWALDIVAQFPKEESSARLSTNLDTWLHEIEDEDDREQIELWAKQVAKGKITEEEFGGKVNGL
jgi:tetratricopeptide (TPR) repeat protein